MNETKPFYKSKTFWFNAAGAAFEITQLLSDAQVMPPGMATLALAIGNILLRRITAQPMTFLK